MVDWVWAIGETGYAVSIGVGRTGLHVVTAIYEWTHETFIVRGADLHVAVHEVARQTGIGLDGIGSGARPTFLDWGSEQ